MTHVPGNRGTLIAITLILLPAIAPSPGQAQVLYGSLIGNVTDSSYAPVSGASLTLLNPQTGQKYSATGDTRGFYAFRNVSGGSYTLDAGAAGFNPYRATTIQVAINTVTRLDVVLQVGSLHESISVSDAASALQTATADVHTEIAAFGHSPEKRRIQADACRRRLTEASTTTLRDRKGEQNRLEIQAAIGDILQGGRRPMVSTNGESVNSG